MKGFSKTELAARAGWHGVSKVSKIESAARPISAIDLRTWCRVCEVSPYRTEELAAEQQSAASLWLSYARLNRAGIHAAQVSVRDEFERARILRSYQGKFMPGLLQTAGYTDAILTFLRARQGSGRNDHNDVAEAVRERMERQHILRSVSHRFVFVIEEEVLRHRVCDDDTMIGQLIHLSEVTRLPAVSLGVIPLAVDRRRILPTEAFIISDMDSVSVELVSGVLTVTNPSEITMYLREFNDLASIAVWGNATRGLIKSALAALR